VAAVVAAQLVVALVQGHAGVAAAALADPAAVVAQQGGREASAVEEDQHLLAGLQGLLDGLLQWAGDATVEWAALHVQAQEARLPGAACALGQSQQAVATGIGVLQAFQRGGGGAQQDRHVLLAGANDGQVAGVVAQAFLLFIGSVVFFVDDDQPRVLHGGEQG
jgi:hypothetical protein